MKSQFFTSCSFAALLMAAPAMAQDRTSTAEAGQTAANGDATTDNSVAIADSGNTAVADSYNDGSDRSTSIADSGNTSVADSGNDSSNNSTNTSIADSGNDNSDRTTTTTHNTDNSTTTSVADWQRLFEQLDQYLGRGQREHVGRGQRQRQFDPHHDDHAQRRQFNHDVGG
ncbi:hypothetical protein AB5I41_08910 [Sphingomonas sp. MMS24-JH45]